MAGVSSTWGLISIVGSAAGSILTLWVAFEGLAEERRRVWIRRMTAVLPARWRPVEEDVPERMVGTPDFARTVDDVRQVAAYDTNQYKPEDTIGFDELLSWWRAFPRGLIVARAPDGRITGSLGLWPVPADWLNAVPAGANPEKYLTGKMIAEAVASPSIEHCYIGGIGVEDPGAFVGKCEMVLMIQKGLLYLSDLANFSRSACFYAIPASGNDGDDRMPGLDLIVRLKFELVPGKQFRPELYCGRRDSDFHERISQASRWILTRTGKMWKAPNRSRLPPRG